MAKRARREGIKLATIVGTDAISEQSTTPNITTTTAPQHSNIEMTKKARSKKAAYFAFAFPANRDIVTSWPSAQGSTVNVGILDS